MTMSMLGKQHPRSLDIVVAPPNWKEKKKGKINTLPKKLGLKCKIRLC